MLIGYIAVLNAEKSEVYARNACKNAYFLSVNMVNSPSRTWKQNFFFQWKRVIKQKKLYIRIVDNEIRLLLPKNEDIQSYIDLIKVLIEKTNKLTHFKARKEEEVNNHLRQDTIKGKYIDKYSNVSLNIL